MYPQDIEPIKEIFPEISLLYLLPERAMGCGYDAHINLYLFTASNGKELLIIQYGEQLYL